MVFELALDFIASWSRKCLRMQGQFLRQKSDDQVLHTFLFQSCLILFHFVPTNLLHTRYPNPHRCTCGMFWICSGSVFFWCFCIFCETFWEISNANNCCCRIQLVSKTRRGADELREEALRRMQALIVSIHEFQFKSTERTLAGWRKTAAGRRKEFPGTWHVELGFKRTARLVWALFDFWEDLDEERKIMEAAAAKVQLQFCFAALCSQAQDLDASVLDDWEGCIFDHFCILVFSLASHKFTSETFWNCLLIICECVDSGSWRSCRNGIWKPGAE